MNELSPALEMPRFVFMFLYEILTSASPGEHPFMLETADSNGDLQPSLHCDRDYTVTASAWIACLNHAGLQKLLPRTFCSALVTTDSQATS